MNIERTLGCFCLIPANPPQILREENSGPGAHHLKLAMRAWQPPELTEVKVKKVSADGEAVEY